jgi:hypothetical protein
MTTNPWDVSQQRAIMLPKLLCMAATRAGGKCGGKSLDNGRCKLHGGLSTGPKTVEGKTRISDAQKRRWAAYRAKMA